MELRRYLPVFAALFLMFGLVESSSAAWTMADLMGTDLKTAISGLGTLFVEYGGYIIGALGIIFCIRLVSKFF